MGECSSDAAPLLIWRYRDACGDDSQVSAGGDAESGKLRGVNDTGAVSSYHEVKCL
jgi:hypothetical protein